MAQLVRVVPYPDEEIGSLLTRTLRRVGLREAELAYWYLGLPRRPLSAIDNLVPVVADLVGSTPRRVLHQHTLVPYGCAGLAPGDSRRVLIDLTSGRKPIHPRILGKIGLRWCETCVRQELASVAESYWHRSHLLPGVATCVLHGSPLTEYNGHLSTRTIDCVVKYWLDVPLPHELTGTPLELSTPPSMLHAVSAWSEKALKGRRALSDVVLSPTIWRKVFGPDFVHFAGCTNRPIASFPQTTAKILSSICLHRAQRFGTAEQLELML